MKTAVEFLELMFLRIITFDSEIQRKKYKDVIRQAKEMEKQQIENAFFECWKANMPEGFECKLSAKEYYNETFNLSQQDKP